MLIQRMSAVFGRLRNETLQLQDGLNIIEAPNETGKSTWCAFLTAMLYGINSRERDKAGFIADKNRYAPWDGGSMSGRLECHADGADLTITRATRRQTAPMADFQAVYTSTASPVDGLTGTNCGETLLGVSREVFERSAFIRQSGLAITQDAGLERRVASLISSGDEDTSYTEAYDALKKQLNRRRFNKSGQLPALEAELAEVQQQLDSSVQLQQQLADALERSQSLESDVQALSDELAQHDQWEAAQKRRQLAALTTDADTAAQRVHSLTQQLEEDRVINACVGPVSGETLDFHVLSADGLSAPGDVSEVLRENPSVRVLETIPMQTVAVNDLMEQLGGAPKILNLDIEGMEMEILRSIDFDKYRPTAMIIEMIPYSKQLVAGQKNQEILRFMQEKGYVEYAFTGINSIFLDMKFYEKVTGVSLEK